MRKLLLVIAAAMALFTVGAFAASFAVSSEDIASGANAVDACSASVDIEFDDAVVSSAGVWTVNGASATFADTGCDGFDAQLAVVAGGSDAVTSAKVTVAGNTATFTFAPTNVEDIVNASIMVDGVTIPAV